MSSREAQTQKDACDQHKKRVKKLLIKIQDCNDADRRRQLLRDCKVEMQRFKSSISNFQDELEPIRDANVRNEFSEQLKDLTKTYKKCLKKYDGLNDTPRQELLSGGRRRKRDMRGAGNDEMLEAGVELSNATNKKLEQTLKQVGETEEIAEATASRLVEQGEQLGRVSDKVNSLDEELDRADKLLSRFMRRAYTDKVIVAFICLILVAVAFIIVYATFIKPDQTTFNVPENAKPPAPSDVANQASSRRLASEAAATPVSTLRAVVHATAALRGAVRAVM